jgi:hypothetical protein
VENYFESLKLWKSTFLSLEGLQTKSCKTVPYIPGELLKLENLPGPLAIDNMEDQVYSLIDTSYS